MLDDEVTIMNEISKPPPPPPPEREGSRRQDSRERDRQNRGNSDGGRNMRRKDGGHRFNDRKRDSEQMDRQIQENNGRQVGFQGNSSNQMQQQPKITIGGNNGNQMQSGMGMGTSGGNMNIGVGGGRGSTMNMGGSVGRNMPPMGSGNMNTSGGNMPMGSGNMPMVGSLNIGAGINGNMPLGGSNMPMGGGNMNLGGGGGNMPMSSGGNMPMGSGGNMKMGGPGPNMNMGAGGGNINMGGMSSMPMNLEVGPGMSTMANMPMQISPTSQPAPWMSTMSQLPMPGPNQAAPSMPGSLSNMPNQMQGSMPPPSHPMTSMSQSQPTMTGHMTSMPPPMMPPGMSSRGPDGQMIGPMMPGMDPATSQSQMMGPMMDQPGPMMPPQGPMMDPSMMTPWSLPSMVGTDGQLIKQPITYRLSVLYPPNPQAPPPTTRERPPGCRTVFIGGLPENATEETVVDVFAKCGEIQTVRMSKKNFCHIRYCAEYCVDNAIYLSGWRMRMDNCSDGPNTGRLHVDFAQARDDLYEWECKQRSAERESRHRTRLIEDMNRPPSPPPVVHFSDHEAHTVTEEIRGEASEESDNWEMAVNTLMTWLERGDCNKRNAHTFFTMIQAASSHVKRLLGDQTEYEQELTKMKEDFKKKLSAISAQFSQIERVFGSAGHQKVWDHFTKAQRKNITAWKKQLQDVQTITKNTSMEEEEDMDLEDEQEKEEPSMKKKKKYNPDKLREESEEWACQAQTYRNEVESVKADMKSELETKEQQIKILQQTLQGMQQQLLEAQKKSGNLPEFLMDSQEKKLQSKSPVKTHDVSAEEDKLGETETNDTSAATASNDPITETSENLAESSCKPKIALAGEDAKLVAVIATFLNVHPFGAGTDYIWSYLLRVDPSVKHSEVEQLMEKYTNCFRMEVEGVGANLARKWKLIAFNPV
eukprot:GFUD01014019.1.p1 GENE.GFUD01014019.1~~GFUD01014019.1.p1  ORF type:complete len:925 (+),score=301.25 GFUD01014019.1:57-2831(+)